MPSLHRASWIIAALALLALGSCENPLCACSPPPSAVVVRGTLRTPTDVPLAGYRVRGEQAVVSEGACGTFVDAFLQRVTDTDGVFLMRFDGLERDSLCVRFLARDTTAGSLEQSLTDTVRVQPRLFPFDTVAVALVLTP